LLGAHEKKKEVNVKKKVHIIKEKKVKVAKGVTGTLLNLPGAYCERGDCRRGQKNRKGTRVVFCRYFPPLRRKDEKEGGKIEGCRAKKHRKKKHNSHGPLGPEGQDRGVL